MSLLDGTPRSRNISTNAMGVVEITQQQAIKKSARLRKREEGTDGIDTVGEEKSLDERLKDGCEFDEDRDDWNN